MILLMKSNSIFLVVIALIVSLTGCSVNKQNLKASNQVPNTNTPKVDNTIKENNELPILLSTIDDAKNGKEIIFTNGYKSNLMPEGEKYYIVEAGALKSDPKQGLAIIKTTNKDGTKILTEKKLLTPQKHGSIKIDGINAFNMDVTAKDGYKWMLNVYDGFRIIPQ
ncbi:MAG: hypothetical protein WCQ54_01085 [Clostridiaceae bacterium]